MDLTISKSKPIVFMTCDESLFLECLSTARICAKCSNQSLNIKILVSDYNCSDNIYVNNSIIEVISVSSKDLSNFPEFKDSYQYISRAMYIRLLIPNLFPEIEFAIYLDVDTLPLIDIGQLWEKRSDFLIQGVRRGYHKYLEEIGFFYGDIYINSGVLIINCKRWRQEKIKEKIFIFLEQTEKFFHPDQDALNIICRGNIGVLSARYNVNPLNPETNISEPELEEFISGLSAIFHFYGPLKPWNGCFDIFYQYLWCALGEYPLPNITMQFCDQKEFDAYRRKALNYLKLGLIKESNSCLEICRLIEEAV